MRRRISPRSSKGRHVRVNAEEDRPTKNSEHEYDISTRINYHWSLNVLFSAFSFDWPLKGPLGGKE